MIRIEKKGKRIEVHSDRPLPGFKTAIPGAYETVAGYWTVPLSLESGKLLQERYGKELHIGSELRRWARGVQQSRKYMSRLSAAEDATLHVLPRVAPKLAEAMERRTYQRVGVRFIADNHATLEADDPGLGKTLMALGGILEAEVPGPYLVVAPKTASESVWKREIQRWLPKPHRAVTVPELRLQRERRLALTRYGPHTWLIVHPEMVLVQEWILCGKKDKNGKKCTKRTAAKHKQQRVLDCGHVKPKKAKRQLQYSYPRLFDIEWGAVIVDESHESLIRRGSSLTQRRRGLDLLKLRADGIKIAMSGTPFDSKPEQLWGTLNWLDPVHYSAFHRWAELYWQKGGYTGFEIGEFRKDREKMLWDSLSAIAIRRVKSEVAQDLPPKMHVGTPYAPGEPDSPLGVWLEMDGKQEKAYREMEELSATELDSGRLEAVTALAELTRLKQLACAYGDIVPVKKNGELHYKYTPSLPSNKFDWVVESLEEWGYPKDPLTKVVIVSFYTSILEVFAQGLEKHFRTKKRKPLTCAITGRTPLKDRRKIIERFNEPGNEQVMMLNVRAGGTAITIDSADRMIFLSETRVPTQQEQAEDRIHRVSNPRQCMYYYLRSLGTVDVGTAIVNQEMLSNTHRLLDTRRGVEYVQRVLDLSKPL